MRSFVLLFITSLILHTRGQTTRIQNGSVCVNGPSFQYDGMQNVTRSGAPCLRWDTAPSNLSLQVPLDGEDHNYCRNPDHNPTGIWCYTSFVNRTRGLCFLPKCETDARMIWTAYDVEKKSTHLFALNADPEFIRQKLSPRNTVNVEQYFNSTGARSEIWTLTSDYDTRQIFFVDYRGEYIGVHNFNTSTTRAYHDGLGHGIESLAYDPFSLNLYWTDSTLKWVMATDSTFTHYTIVRRTEPDPPFGLTLHTSKRLLFFSTFRNFKTKVWRTDLAGRNATIILRYPQVDDVTGLTIDYNENKLYWTDLVGRGSKISSANLDGSNRTQIHFSSTAIYWNLGVYLNYVYASDVRVRFTRDGHRRYYIFIVNKEKTSQVLNYGLTSKPRGITIFQRNNATSRSSDYPQGECSFSPPCEQMCLPSLVGRRRCACGLGYYQSGETNCTTHPISDESIIFADAGQGKIYHLPLSSNIRANYSIIPIALESPQSILIESRAPLTQDYAFNNNLHKSHRWKKDATRFKISTVAVNIPQRFLYWALPQNASVMRSTFDGGNMTKILSGHNVKTMAIDQQTGYIYFSDNEFEYIYVMDMNGEYLKTLYKPSPRRANISSIVALALDLRNKFIYWTDTNGATGKGELRRMRFDGSTDTVVFANLSRPSGLSIDLESDRLYLGEGTLLGVFSFPLWNLTQTSNDVVSRNTSTFFNLRSSFRQSSSFLSDVKVWNGRAFVYDSSNRSIEMFDLARGVASIRMFGPREFFRIMAMSLYSVSYYRNFLSTQSNPCNPTGSYSNYCSQLCLAATNVTFDCDCQDGWSHKNGACSSSATAPVDNPPLALSCEADRTITLEPCQNSTEVSWASPIWFDDNTASQNLTFVTPNLTSPAVLSVGIHQFSYTATDLAGNTGTCSFSVQLRNLNCGPRPFIKPYLNIRQTEPSCSIDRSDVFFGGFIYSLSCVSGEQISFGRYSNSTLINQCLPTGSWRYSNFYGLVCGPPRTHPYPSPTTATTAVAIATSNATERAATTTGSIARSTARSTTGSTTRSATGSSTGSATGSFTGSATGSSTESSEGSSQRSSTGSSTESSTGSSTESSTGSSTESSTESSTGSSTGASTGSIITSTTRSTTSPTTQATKSTTTKPVVSTTSKKEEPPYVEKMEKSVSHLTNGGIAGITIAILVLIVILVAVLFLKNKKVNTSSSFPFWWKKKDDGDHLQENVFDDINHYTVL